MKRLYYILFIISFIGICLVGRLIYLQGVVGQDLAVLSLLNRIQEVKLTDLRGDIVDAHGQQFTNREKEFVMTIFPMQLQKNPKNIDTLTQLMGWDKTEILRVLKENVKPFRIQKAVIKTKAAFLQKNPIDGVVVSEEYERYGQLASHIIGYCNMEENRGISGLEFIYDHKLHTEERLYLAALIDVQNQLIDGLTYRKLQLPSAIEQKKLILTLDFEIQKQVEHIFDQYAMKGAIVVMRPQTGELIACVSRPNFSANYLELYLNREDAPLMNRVISAYQPGSIFKLVVAAAALEKNLVNIDEKFVDKGYIEIGDTTFYGWDYKTGEKEISFLEAMAYSSNPVFIEVGQRIGMEELVGFAKKLGFASRTSLDFLDEATGNLPLPQNIYRGELANLSIGQGECEVTPLQMAAFVSTIINDGMKVQPCIIKRNIDESTNQIRLFSIETAEKLRQMMIGVNQYGTGREAWLEAGGSAGKTGTAETGRKDGKGKNKNHAWYVGYAPLDAPQYVVVVFVEDGRSGGQVAAPIFKEIVKNILE